VVEVPGVWISGRCEKRDSRSQVPLYFSTSTKKPRTAARELLSCPSQPREPIEIENQSELGGGDVPAAAKTKCISAS
jgi:hypothetical protein